MWKDSKLVKAFKAHSMNSDEKNLKLEMQYEIRRLVRSSAARIAAKRAAGLEQIKMEGFADGFHAAQTKYAQQLTEQKEEFKRQLTEQEETFKRQGAWLMGFDAAWAKAEQLQAQQEAAFMNTFLA